jgi:hypothetical protein
MKKSRFTDSQIVEALKRAEAGVTVPELCRELGVSSATFYKWRAKFGGMDTVMPASKVCFTNSSFCSGVHRLRRCTPVMTSIRLVLLNELISVLIGVFLLHILRNTRGTVNQGATSLFTYNTDEQALALARAMDGKLLVVTNVSDLRAQEVVARYKSLADIERGFKVLKSEIEIGPVHHRLPDRIRAHAMTCFIALMIRRVMRARLNAHPVDDVIPPERALWCLRRIQTHRVILYGSKMIAGISSISQAQAEILESLGVKKPTYKDRYRDL